jgi:hypothetical protein
MPSSLARALLAAFLAAAPPVGQAASGPEAPPSATRVELYERVVAVVDGRPLLLSEVRALQVLKGLDEDKARKEAIEERLMYQEAARLPQADVSAGEEDRFLGDLEAKRPDVRGRIEEGELRRLVRRELAILKYVEFRFRPEASVSEEEVRRAFEAEGGGRDDAAAGSGGPPGRAGPSFDQVQAQIRERLEQRALGERIEAWVKDLRDRASIRYVPERGGTPDEGGSPEGP